jgi:hypothetical protein
VTYPTRIGGYVPDDPLVLAGIAGADGAAGLAGVAGAVPAGAAGATGLVGAIGAVADVGVAGTAGPLLAAVPDTPGVALMDALSPPMNVVGKLPAASTIVGMVPDGTVGLSMYGRTRAGANVAYDVSVSCA